MALPAGSTRPSGHPGGRWPLGTGGSGPGLLVEGRLGVLRDCLSERPPLPRRTRVTGVVALDAGGRTVARAERDPVQLSHPVCHLFR